MPQRHAAAPSRDRSRWIRDRRWQAGGAAAAIAALLAWLGLRPPAPDPEADVVALVGAVIDDAQAQWYAIARGAGRAYDPARVVLFRGATSGACGRAETAAGPFYCPADGNVYVDLAFMARVRSLASPAAQAYVIAHELGHHLQHAMGVAGADRSSVAIELQADCIAGAWIGSALERGVLPPGTLEAGAIVRAAAAAGDPIPADRTQPDRWTHGTADQRANAVRIGLMHASPCRCDLACGVASPSVGDMPGPTR